MINLTNEKATYLVKTNKNNAREIIKDLNNQTDGKGGGKPDLAQGGTQDITKMTKYLIKEKLI